MSPFFSPFPKTSRPTKYSMNRSGIPTFRADVIKPDIKYMFGHRRHSSSLVAVALEEVLHFSTGRPGWSGWPSAERMMPRPQHAQKKVAIPAWEFSLHLASSLFCVEQESNDMGVASVSRW